MEKRIAPLLRRCLLPRYARILKELPRYARILKSGTYDSP
jgi:hypothetical protein